MAKKLEYKWYDGSKWCAFDPLNNVISIESVLKGDCDFRLAQEMITIGGVSFPKPETQALKEGQDYFIPNLASANLYFWTQWTNAHLDVQRLKQGVVHLTGENAVAHTKALIKLSGGNVDD